MNGRRYSGRDMTYSDAHRAALPERFGRIGHRMTMADRDWTEFCHWCKTPLLLAEEVRDAGQDLLDKSVRVTVELAKGSHVKAVLFGWQIARPRRLQAEIDHLNDELRRLEAQTPIVGFRMRRLYPVASGVMELTPDAWWSFIRNVHTDHWATCTRADLADRKLARLPESATLWDSGAADA